MKRLVLVMVLVLAMAGVSFANDPHDPLVPTVTETRLLSWGGASVIVIYIDTPYKEAMYDIRWVVFNSHGEKIRHGGSMGWYIRPPGDTHFVFEESMKLLNGDGYFVRAWIKKFAPMVENER